MASPTTRLRAMLQAYNTNPEVWGNLLNEALQMLDNGFGVDVVTVSGSVVLDVQDYIESEGQKTGLILTGTGGTLTIPARDRIYMFKNACSGDVEVIPEGGTGAIVREGANVWLMTDGDVAYVSDPFGDAVAYIDGKLPGTITISTSAPTGGSDGDIHFRVLP